MAKKKSSKKVKKKSTKKTAKTKVQSKKSSAKASKKKSKSSKAVSSKAQSKKSSKKRSPQKSDNKTSLKKLNYSEIDKRIMEILLTKDSVVISDVKTQLNLTDSEVTKSIKRLESKKKITSKSIMDKSKWTTAIFKIDDYGLTLTSKTKKNSQKLVWDTFNDCPCFLCPKIHKCSSGQNYNNPKSCVDLSNWLDASVNNIPYISPYHPNFELKKKKSQSNVKDEKAKIGA